MKKSIELPISLFNRLAKHAGGFDTPTDVITRLLDFYENQPISETYSDLDSDEDIIKQAFQINFNVEPRPFGQKASSFSGYSDDSKGVQWNIEVDKVSGNIILGVNLEGMKYKDWPITHFLLKESKETKLLDLKGIDSADIINVKMTRDAWQAAARPLIKEQNITPEGLKLSELTYDKWMDIINESLGCLDEKKQFKARGKQSVNRIKSGDYIEMDVSPHLGFKVVITNTEPTNFNLFFHDLKKAQSILMPLYKFVSDRTK